MKDKDSRLIYEAYGSPGPEAFMMDEQDWEQAKQDLSDEANQPGLPEVLDIFKKEQSDSLDKPQPVVITAWQTQKHYGKIHKSGTKVAGESINDALGKLASGGDYPKKGYIIQKIEVDREGVDHEKRRHDHAGKHAYPNYDRLSRSDRQAVDSYYAGGDYPGKHSNRP